MPTKKSDHKHVYEDVMVHFTDRDWESLLSHFRIGRCKICGKFKNSVLFESELTPDHMHRMLRPHEVIEKYKHLPQYHLKSTEIKWLS